ncbi:MAG: ATP-dependent DNA helicase RecG [Lachnospiraceae bacterium]|nr:ATP-dependent DNA helicase RecG [Lachnospiraceae bacterium]MBD5481244.1 ATP-dependent DNA helicase RecG [Lachnospiraceae bacterium]
MISLTSPVTEIKGIGQKYAQLLEKLNIKTVYDMLTYYPMRYEAYPQILSIQDAAVDEKQAVSGIVTGSVSMRRVRSLSILTFSLSDETGVMPMTVFNMPYLRNSVSAGKCFVCYGRVVSKGNKKTMEQPTLFKPEDYLSLAGTLQPRYHTVKGITTKTILSGIRKALNAVSDLSDAMPYEIRKRYDLMEYRAALERIHFPSTPDLYVEARRRLVFQEFLYFLVQMKAEKTTDRQIPNAYPLLEVAQTKRLIESLPYRLTDAQLRVWGQIEADLQADVIMNRLVQGDVGSGKTIIAVLALLMTVANGLQGAMMAPTEVLARQHYAAVKEMTKRYDLPFVPVLLTGSLTAKEKREAYAAMEDGTANVIIGTHALIQEKARYHSLALVITDEQHRFGVRQREALAEKGAMPHILVMSATPIPRTLAMILFGDLSISTIDEYPKNRIPIKNCVLHKDKRESAYHFILKQLHEGRQAYVICPMVEEGVSEELENVVAYTDKLREAFPENIRISFLHGKMKNAEKNRIMDAFAAHDIDILVSTTVVEVGIDVPNATVILIENAERFGLAGLHQLRGRVGRGSHQSYCIFMTDSSAKETEERLDILVHSNDGFHIANEDMRLRGPGDLFGIRQSGILSFRLGDIYQDSMLLKQAAECADTVLAKEELLTPVMKDIQAHDANMPDYRTI